MLERRAISLFLPGLFSLSGNGKESPPSDSRAAGGERPDPDGSCILVVDDEADAVESIIELLESEGYPAMGARNGREALALLEKGERPGLILLDLKMPVMDGWDFCAAIEHDQRFANIPVAIVTASASLHALPDRRNDAGFFVKPINFDRLLRVVRETCR